MDKSVLISIRPEWCELIASGEKTIEVRKTFPKLNVPFKVYIYCTQGPDMLWILKPEDRKLFPEKPTDVFTAKDAGGAYRGNGSVIGEFTCDTYVIDKTFGHDPLFNVAACMSEDDAADYAAGSPLYGWHISNLKIYDAPRELDDFRRICKNGWWCDSCAMYWEHNGTCGNASLQIRRPPQSWCYVEVRECIPIR